MKLLLLLAGLLLLLATEILRVYFIMPFPGSQQSSTIGLAYFIHHNRVYLRLLGLLLISFPLYTYMIEGKLWRKILLLLVIVFYGLVCYVFNFRFSADKIFHQPTVVKFADSAANTMPLDKLVIGVDIGGEAKAYPIQLIGYHHQVRDTIGGTPVMVTYCTVCRTGRVFSPRVNGREETFRLVGMDHFNALFEDGRTKSWWQQATGIAVAGALKGTQLIEIRSRQSSLRQWLTEHPSTKILQPDTLYKKQYEDLTLFDNGTIKGRLEKRDSASWQPKSWVIAVRAGTNTKAYDWNHLVNQTLIQDTVGAIPVLLVLGPDSTTFYVLNRNVQGQTLQFKKASAQNQGPSPDQQAQSPAPAYLTDNNGSAWSLSGRCLSGPLKDQQLQTIQSYQEFWHSWSHFHPESTRYTK